MLGKLNSALFFLFILVLAVNYSMISNVNTNVKDKNLLVDDNKMQKDSLEVCDQDLDYWVWEPNRYSASGEKEGKTILDIDN